ncbi:non-ribosomal peptide synthetase, partial [Microbulbifer epialgicus]
FNEGRENPLGPLSVQYADYAVWQREWLSGDVLAEQLGYWQKQLRGLPPVHSLPLDKTRPSKQSFIGARYCQTLNKGLTEGIQRFCRTRDVTLFMFIHTVLSILLSRYSNENDIVIGTPIAGRVHHDVEPLIGFFANTLVLRSDLSINLTFTELLQKNKEIVIDAYEHQEVPFELLVETLNPERNLGYSPLFQILLTLQNNEQSELTLGELNFSSVSSVKFNIKYDLELSLVESNNELLLGWTYNKDLFEEVTVRQLASSFRVLLEGAMVSPGWTIKQLPILTESQRNKQLYEWNNTAKDYQKNIVFPELFEKQVLCSPDKTAVIFEGNTLSYQELNAKANQLANYLMEQEMAPNKPIGLFIERSIEMLVALLGIMKAGYAYLPLDPSYPKSRLEYILQDAGISIVVTQLSLKNLLRENKLKLLILDDNSLQDELFNYSKENLPSSIELNTHSLAYVIYTSGSTGKPKGVMIEQRALVNFLFAMQDILGRYLSVKTKMLAISSFAFDMSILELYGPLSSGGQIILASQEDAKNPQSIIKLLGMYDINFLQATPTTWKLLMDAGWQGKNDLIALAGGEAVSTNVANYLLSNCGHWANCYGPTEATVWSMVNRNLKAGSEINLGGPLNNYRHYICDDFEQLVPIGVVGELYIAGNGLARGYLNRPDLTKEKFIQNPFSNNSEEQLYKTGDLVRCLPNGTLDFIGRVDDQVKLRGFRIELGEIEVEISKCEEVDQVHVLLKSNENQEDYLVAYIILTGAYLKLFAKKELSQRDIIDSIKENIGKFIPRYMIPKVFHFLEAIPLLPTGKVDKKCLVGIPDVDFEPKFHREPCNNIEYKLLNIWEELLGINNLSVEDDFFEVGGHSLLAAKLIHNINNIFNIDIPISTLFENSTVRSLGEIISKS